MSARAFIALLGAALAAGCSTLDGRHGSVPADADVEALVPGESTTTGVLEALGAPHAVARHGRGFALLYEEVLLDEDQLSLNIETWSVELFKFTLGGSTARHTAVLLMFDADGVLDAVGRASWDQDVGGGVGIQFVFDVQSVVDTSGYTVRTRDVDWGAAMLLPPLTVMNRAARDGLTLLGDVSSAGSQASADARFGVDED